MTSKYKEDAYVNCPMYTKNSYVDIKCRGLCGTHTTNSFKSKKDMLQYMDDFCRSMYWNCPLYRALEENDDEEN